MNEQRLNYDIFFFIAIGKFVYGFRTGLLDQTLTDENRKFYESIKIVMAGSFKLSLSKWMKYIYWRTYKEFKNGMRDWYEIGLKHTKTVTDLVKAAKKTGKDLDEDLGT